MHTLLMRKKSSLLILAFTMLSSLQLSALPQQTRTYIAHYLEPFKGAQVYRDPKSGTLIYLETDGRHLTAISPKGKLLWIRDPFADAHLEYYRTKTPKIVQISSSTYTSVLHGKAAGTFIAILYNSSQFGYVQISNGDFEDGGQD